MEIIEREFGKGTLSLETGRLARQANGSVLVRYGDTMVLVAATAAKGSGIGAEFFPLSVFYVEKAYAAGRIPGGFFKREARLSDSETLISRLIDRPLRPSFHEHYQAETLIVATVLSHDLDFPSDVAAMIGASAALSVSDIPLLQPIGGIRVGRVDGEFITNPDRNELSRTEINIFMAGSQDAILMVEGEANEVSESILNLKRIRRHGVRRPDSMFLAEEKRKVDAKKEEENKELLILIKQQLKKQTLEKITE